MSGKRALVASIVDPARNGRTRRVVEALQEAGWVVDVACGVVNTELPVRRNWFLGIDSTPVDIPWSLRRLSFRLSLLVSCALSCGSLVTAARRISFALFGGRKIEKIFSVDYELVVVEDFHLLALILEFKREARVVYDSRDYYHRLHEYRRLWERTFGKVFRVLSSELLPKCDEVITVSESLAGEFRREFGLDARVVRSIPSIETPLLNASQENTRSFSPPIRLLYHGRADFNRGLLKLGLAVQLSKIPLELDLFLSGPTFQRLFLRTLLSWCSRINFRRPVHIMELVNLAQRYDIGLALFPPKTTNLNHALPNKFFEYLNAGLPVAVGPGVGMSSIVSQFELGLVCQEWRFLQLRSIFEQVTEESLRAWQINVREFIVNNGWQEEKKKLLRILDVAR